MGELDKPKNKEIIDSEFQIMENFSEDNGLTRIGPWRKKFEIKLCDSHKMTIFLTSIMFIFSILSFLHSFRAGLVPFGFTLIMVIIEYCNIKFNWCGCDECDPPKPKLGRGWGGPP